MSDLPYLNGFLNHFETEARPGALPKDQNSPQKPPLGLYPEQVTGTPFTAPRHRNLKSWLYKIQPSVVQGKFEEVGHPTWMSSITPETVCKTPQALRFQPHPLASGNSQKTDFYSSIFTYAFNGSSLSNAGCAVHLFSCNETHPNRFIQNADAEMMIVLETGEARFITEMGILELSPLWIGVIPRGIKFRVELQSPEVRGYVCENFGQPFLIPDLGPIGANGLANPRHFETPVASFEDRQGDFELLTRYQGTVWRAPLKHSPLDTVAWHGNYAPYRYDLRKYNTINSVSFDHPDPSIFTVLTSPSAVPGTANIDFVIFPPRWMVAENTFRPPYYHRNVMNEVMGLIQGHYDAKPTGFKPGGLSIHNCMTGHGPDAESYLKASTSELKPDRYQNTMAFMWESNLAFATTHQALQSKNFETDYFQAWQALPRNFK